MKRIKKINDQKGSFKLSDKKYNLVKVHFDNYLKALEAFPASKRIRLLIAELKAAEVIYNRSGASFGTYHACLVLDAKKIRKEEWIRLTVYHGEKKYIHSISTTRAIELLAIKKVMENRI